MQSFWKTIITSILAIVGVSTLLVLALITYILVDFSADPAETFPAPNVINDVTQLNPITVTTVIQPLDIEDIRQAIISTNGVIRESCNQ